MNSLEQLTRFEETEMQPQGMAWPDLSEEPLPLFPTELLPEKCARLVEAVAASLPVPVDYAACALLGAASAALVGRVFVRARAEWPVPVQLYQCMVGESGTKKTASLHLMNAPLQRWLMERQKEVQRRNRNKEIEREAYEARSKNRKISIQEKIELRQKMEEIENEPEYEVVMQDITPEALPAALKRQGGKGIIHSDEAQLVNTLAGGTYSKSGGVANIDIFLHGDDGSPAHIERVGSGRITIESVNISLTLGMQYSIVKRMTGNSDLVDRGLPQRMLFYMPDNLINVDLRHLPSIPKELLDGWERLLLCLAEAHRDKPTTLNLTRRAQEQFLDHWQDMNDRALTDMGGSMVIRAWARKAHGKTARLAGLLALLEDPDAAIVEESHVRAAVAMMNSYFIPHMKRAFGGSSDLSPDALALVDVLRGRESISQSQLLHDISGQKKYKGEAGKAHFQEIITELAAAGYIRLTTPASGGIGRRPGPVLLVNPALHGNHKAAVPLTEGTI